MNNLTYVRGALTAPISSGPQIIAHVCNDLGDWCTETANQISRKWPEAERSFRNWYRRRSSNDFGLGGVQFITIKRVDANRITRVANMVAQRGTEQQPKTHRFRAHTIAWCLSTVAVKAARLGATVHLPSLSRNQPDGSVLDVESIIRSILCDSGISVFIYEESNGSFEGQTTRTTRRLPIRRRFELFDSWYKR